MGVDGRVGRGKAGEDVGKGKERMVVVLMKREGGRRREVGVNRGREVGGANGGGKGEGGEE